MKCYIGTKVIVAEPQTHEDGREGYRVVYPDGYASWSPKDTFEQAYREISDAEEKLIESPDLHAAAARGPITDEEAQADLDGVLRPKP